MNRAPGPGRPGWAGGVGDDTEPITVVSLPRATEPERPIADESPRRAERESPQRAERESPRRAERESPQRAEESPRRAERERRRAPRRRRRGLVLLSVVVLLGALMAGGYLLYQERYAIPDYDGPGFGDVVVEVQDGDSILTIGRTLVEQDVVRSARAFTEAAAKDEARARRIQPGFYQLRHQMAAEDALTMMLDPASRVGQLEIKGGVQLDDVRLPNGTVTPGVLSLISEATCAELDGRNTCIPAAELRTTMATTPPERLGVPDWALDEVRAAPPNRRLEGLLVPGRYNVRPGAPPEEVLRELVEESVQRLESTGLIAAADQSPYTAYELLIIASLVEKEGITSDFDQIARVIYNRLAQGVRLELDSTVNYPLDLQEVRTNANDRARSGPYNSYQNYGLPPTPIGAPGTEAIEATLSPPPGPWMFFVRCEKDGTSCFSVTLAEHREKVADAVAQGAF